MHPLEERDSIETTGTPQDVRYSYRPGAAHSSWWFVVPTRNRGDILRETLPSWLGAFSEYGRSPGVLIADDSDDGLALSKAEVCAPAVGGSPAIIFGKAERRGLVSFLTEKGLPQDPLEFALFGDGSGLPTYGINRNAVLLLLSGKRLVSSDDDALWVPGRLPGSRSIPLLSDRPFPLLLRHFLTRDRALAAVETTEADPIGVHESFLGGHVEPHGEAGSGPAHAIELDLTPDAPEPQLQTEYTGGLRVLATSMGYYGNSAMTSSGVVLFLDRRADHGVENEADYLAALESTEILHVSDRPVLTRKGYFMTMSFAVDNSELLPPFLPVGRGMDAIWAATILACHPDGLLAHLPLAVYHDPPEIRTASRQAAVSYRPRLSEYLLILLRGARIPDFLREPVRRMAFLGDYLQSVGTMGWGEFREFFKDLWLGEAVSQAHHLSIAVEGHGRRPRAWVQDVDEYLEALLEWGRSPELLLPADWEGPGFSQGGRERLLAIATRFGRLLEAWPSMRAAAQEYAGVFTEEDKTP